MCFAQGVLWTLLLNGWRHWNRSAKFSGQSVGARIRRWWWGVNNWKIPNARSSRLRDTKLAKNVSEVSVAFLKVRHRAPAYRISVELTDNLVLSGRILECCSGLKECVVALHVPALVKSNNWCAHERYSALQRCKNKLWINGILDNLSTLS